MIAALILTSSTNSKSTINFILNQSISHNRKDFINSSSQKNKCNLPKSEHQLFKVTQPVNYSYLECFSAIFALVV